MSVMKKKFNARGKFNKSKNVKKTRKELRKEKRQQKKVKRNEHYMKKKKSSSNDGGKNNKSTKNEEIKANKLNKQTKDQNKKDKNKTSVVESNSIDVLAKHRATEEKQKKKLEKQMQKQRTKQLLEANESEDKVIRKLEKQLKLDKKKTKSISKTFAGDGLDYILEMCDSDTRKTVARAEKNLTESDIEAEFEDDLDLIDDLYKKSSNRSRKDSSDVSDSEDDSDDSPPAKTKSNKNKAKVSKSNEFDSEDDHSDAELETVPNTKKQVRWSDEVNNESDSNESEAASDSSLKGDNSDLSDSDSESFRNPKRKKLSSKIEEDEFDDQDGDSSLENESNGDMDEENDSGDEKENESNEWEDIYGRKRDKDGNVLPSKTAYVPPALRKNLSDSEKEAILRLKKEIKGLINRVTVGNMIGVSQQLEGLYNRGKHSRHNLNNTFSDLINEAIIHPVITPIRIVMDHGLLIAILHGNIDIEIGAIYLEKTVEKFDQILHSSKVPAENKELDNVAQILSVLYNLKVFHCVLIHDILRKLITNGLTERNLECVLLMLRIVGPVLRKDDLAMLKQTLEFIQDTINNTPDAVKNAQSTRLKFLANILTSIKNNNFTKIPNYSPDDVPQMRQVLRSALRPGNQVAPLNISLDDLLNAKHRGKWWVVGSAWTGVEKEKDNSVEQKTTDDTNYDDGLLKLAKKCRMNTDSRKRIFLIVMSASDCDEAYERLLRLGLAHGQERDIINVLIFCCLNERSFNPYYSVVAQKFCDYQRKYKIMLQCTVRDQIREITQWTSTKSQNLAKFLIQLFLNGGLTLSVLNNIELSDLNVKLLRFLRITLFGILLLDDVETVTRVWSRAGGTAKFREGLRIFIEQFLLRSNVIEGLQSNKKELLESRAKIALKILQQDYENAWSM